MDEDELIGGGCAQELKRAEFCRSHYWAHNWRWLDIGGGGPVMPAQAGTALWSTAETAQDQQAAIIILAAALAQNGPERPQNG